MQSQNYPITCVDWCEEVMKINQMRLSSRDGSGVYTRSVHKYDQTNLMFHKIDRAYPKACTKSPWLQKLNFNGLIARPGFLISKTQQHTMRFN